MNFFDNLEDELQYSIDQATVFSDYNLIALVENEEDEKFWCYVLNKSFPQKKVFFISYSKIIMLKEKMKF